MQSIQPLKISNSPVQLTRYGLEVWRRAIQEAAPVGPHPWHSPVWRPLIAAVKRDPALYADALQQPARLGAPGSWFEVKLAYRSWRERPAAYRRWPHPRAMAPRRSPSCWGLT